MTTQDIKAKMSDLFTQINQTGGDVEKIKDVRCQMLALTGGNKSECIRVMLGMDMTTAQIAKILNIRYQFVNNVRVEVIRKRNS